jgi:DNA-binding FadR family transcriptional regulator
VSEEVAEDPAAEQGSRAAQVIANVKRMIASGELGAGDRLPVEKVLAERWGVSRGSLREGVRALAALGVLETRQGDGTYVTRLDPGTLLSPLSFYADLQGSEQSADLLAIRRVLETESAGLAAMRMSEADLQRLEDILSGIDEVLASGELDPEAFIDADAEFHGIIVQAAGNATLASLIQNLSSGMLRARMWRTIAEEDAVEITKQRHRDIYLALRAGDAERASAADSLHLAEGEDWLRRVIATGDTLVAGSGQPDGNGHAG